jgi:xylulokinase
MSLLGIDVGTTGCKAAAVRADGSFIASAYAEYPVQQPQPGRAELDAAAVWELIQQTIASVAAECRDDPVSAASVSSLGEAVVPVSSDRRILGPSILAFDERGEEYAPRLEQAFDAAEMYRITGVTVSGSLGLPKLMWIRDHQPQLFARTDCFLPWSAFVTFMLGAEPAVDYSLASRLLCFDIDRADWSQRILEPAEFDRAKLPAPVASGTQIGTVSPDVATRLGLSPNVAIVAGCHDQCANAVGCGAVREGPAACGMGTYFCLTPVFAERGTPEAMVSRGLNTEHHAVPGRFVTFIYNQGGALMRWFRDTFAAAEHHEAEQAGLDIYSELTAEIPAGPSEVIALPHFMATGTPEFVSDTRGVLAGLRLGTQRGDILKGIMEGVVFYLRECVDSLPGTGIGINEFRAAGGGSRSDAWLQICADIMGRPFTRVQQVEAGILGTAIIAGTGNGTFSSCAEGAEALVRLAQRFDPDADSQQKYQARYEQYRKLWPLMRAYLKELASEV